jgi:hypothetical protein
MVAGVTDAMLADDGMNRPLFDPEHLRIAAEVRTKAWRRRWRNLAGGVLFLLIMALGVVLPLIVLTKIVVLLVQ